MKIFGIDTSENLDKKRVSLGFIIGIFIYFAISIIVKLCGLDLFQVTNDIPILQKINDLFMSNLILEDLFASMLFTINMFFVYSIVINRYKIKETLLLCLLTYLLCFSYNLLYVFFGFPEFIMSVLIPLIICLIFINIKHDTDVMYFTKIKNKAFAKNLETIFLYIIFSIIMILTQQGLLFLKVNVLKFSYYSTNIFNTILLNLDAFVIYFAFYKFGKILKERRN